MLGMLGDMIGLNGVDVSDAAKHPTLGNGTQLDLNFGQAISKRNAMSGPQINMAPQDEFRGGQMDFVHALQAQAAGQGPSVAQNQLQAGLDQNIASQMAMAASQRGTNAGMGARMAAQNLGATNQQAAQQAAGLRAQEQLNAQGLLSQNLAQGRSQDIGLASQQAGLDLQSQGQKDAFTQALVNAGNQRDLGLMGAQVQGGIGAANAEVQDMANRQKAFGGFLKSASGAIPGIGKLIG